MGLEHVRDRVDLVPDAAAAFRRANAQVQDEFGRDIDVNRTSTPWSVQLGMYNAWNLYVASGYNKAFYPGHSKAVHPSESFHVYDERTGKGGNALDSDDWVNARIEAILAENGFIRNRLYVPNERHHFEYLRDRDRNYGKPASGGNSVEDDMFTDDDRERQKNIENALTRLSGVVGGTAEGTKVVDHLRKLRDLIDRLTKVLGGSIKEDGTLNGDTVVARLREIRDELAKIDKS